MLHQDKEQLHIDLYMKRFLGHKLIPILEYLADSLDLAACKKHIEEHKKNFQYI